MIDPRVKEAYRFFFYVKGHFNTSHETIMQSYNSYFKRMWCEYEGGDEVLRMCEEFEKEFEKVVDKIPKV